ncbi:NIF-domain-containing protein [Laetiporus sulphureus 93-53]|uniref:NIF-domain-containing protein n=1 Tax=Laetiporus sulphureus 93-53 TaxID=1314785 RepID=A0A165IH94_9APHY|nr:NIF-domain-containing protein [Laetiporus sulphureus 93-53]KZT13070.1 NIF-domain-containing protein [Laetiporus sulphureus 93-53]
MNSLAYLSRQFDVLASPRAPPSTPASEVPPSVAGETRSGRARSWSTKTFRVPSPGGSPERSWTLKRSLSSPAVNAIASVNEPGPYFPRRLSTASPTQAARSSSRRPSLSQTEKATRPKTASESILRSLLFVRIILQFWHAICVAWRSLTRQEPARVLEEVAVEDVSDEEKDTEDESKDEKPVSLDHLESPFQPAIPPPPLHPSPPPPPPAIFPPGPPGLTVSHPLSDTTSPQEPQASVQTAPTSSPSSPADLSTPQHVQAPSRTSTPSVAAHKKPFHLLPKTLVLDLDETLIHSTSRPMHSGSSGGGLLGIFGRGNKGAGHVVEVVLGGRSTLYHVYKRPFVDYFLRKVSGWYTLVVFTASMQEYADPVIDWLDAGRGILTRRFFRESCTQLPNGSYTKDLSIVEADLARVCLIDNSPACYSVNEANGVPIEGWTHDPHDEALLDLLPVLDSLRFTSDVRRVLGIRGFT